MQYASGDYVARLDRIGARINSAAVGTPFETAMAECYFATLKFEGGYVQEYRTCEENESHLGRSIAEVYDAKRLHSSL